MADYADAGKWELVKTDGKTVYHRRRLSDKRRITAKLDHVTGEWSWAVYDLTQGNAVAGVKIDSGTASTWRAARGRAEMSGWAGA